MSAHSEPIVIQFWHTRLSHCSDTLFEETFAHLPTSTQEGILRFVHMKDRKRRLLGRFLLQAMLNDTQTGSLSDVQTDRLGKLYLEDGPAFNISHSGDFVVLAFSLEKEVKIGVDVELIRELELNAVAKTVYDTEELEYLAQSTDREHTFFELWARKESILKACGSGFSIGARTVNCLTKKEVLQEKFHFWPVNIDAGHACCIASNRVILEVKMQELKITPSSE